MSIRDDLKAFVDGELPPLRMAEIQEALDRDASLAREVAELRALSIAVRQSSPVHAVVGLDATLAALQRRNRQRRVWFGLPLGLAAAAAATALAMLNWPHREADMAGTVAFEDSAKAAGPMTKSGGVAMVAPRREDAGAAATKALPTVTPPRFKTAAAGKARPTPSETIRTATGPPMAGSELYAKKAIQAAPSSKSFGLANSETGHAVASRSTPSKASPEAGVPVEIRIPAMAKSKSDSKTAAGEVTTITLLVDSPDDAEARLRAASASLDATVAPADAANSPEPGQRRVELDVPAGRIEEARNLILGLTARPIVVAERSAEMAASDQESLKAKSAQPTRTAADAVKSERAKGASGGFGAGVGAAAPATSQFASGGVGDRARASAGGGAGGFGGGGRSIPTPLGPSAQDAPKTASPAAKAVTPTTPPMAKRRLIVIFRRKPAPAGKLGP